MWNQLRHIWSGSGLVIVGVTIVGLVSVSLVATFEKFSTNLELVRTLERVQREVSRVHLWFEERISGDLSVDLDEDVRQPLSRLRTDFSRFVADAAERSSHSIAMQRDLHALDERLRDLEVALEDRWRHREDGRIGSEQDAAFDAIYGGVLALSTDLSTSADERFRSDRSRLAGIDIAVTALVALLFVLLAVLVWRRQRELQRRNTELERRVEERTRDLREVNEELTAAHDKAESANRAKGEFLANLSHEIRTPLHAVMGTSSLLLGTSTEESVRDRLRTIQSSAESLLHMLDSTLDYSQGEVGRLELDEETFDLRSV
ncbi:MAG: hypothetical protein KDC38_13910, partial [Planctomycetes bacterium]|nr:hypothetical protein [Planctomycetota bacterium]